MSTPAHPDGPLAAKIQGILAIPYNDAALKAALAALDAYEPARVSERTIRTAAEAAVLDAAGRALARLAPAHDAVAGLGAALQRAEAAQARMAELVGREAAQLAPAVAAARALQAELGALQRKQATARAFVDRFVITAHEADVLGNTLLPVDDEFFAVLAKARRILADGHVMFEGSGGDSGGGSAAAGGSSAAAGEAPAGALENTQKALRGAYAKLRWSAEQALQTAAATTPGDPGLRRKLSALAESPLEFKAVLGEVAAARRAELSREFTRTLTRDSEHGKSLDFYSYDPVRYVGNLLAWVHAAIVNEYEHLSLLIDPELSFTPAARSVSADLFASTDAKGIVGELVDSVTRALDAPLRSKVGQLVGTQDKIVVVNELENIVAFYRSMLAKYDQPTVTTTLLHLEKACDAQLDRVLAVEADTARAATPRVPRDLAAPDFWTSILNTTRVILQRYEQGVSYLPDGDPAIRARMDKLVDPLWQQCRTLAAALGDEYRATVFELNCLDDAKLTFASFTFARAKTEQIEAEIATRTDALAALELSALKAAAGFDKVSAADNNTAFYAAFDIFLPMASEQTSQRLRPLVSPRVAAAVAEKANEGLIRAYGEAADEHATRTTAEIRLLLT